MQLMHMQICPRAYQFYAVPLALRRAASCGTLRYVAAKTTQRAARGTAQAV